MPSEKRGLVVGLILILMLAAMVGALTLGSGDGRQSSSSPSFLAAGRP
jgi:hypothetical protein